MQSAERLLKISFPDTSVRVISKETESRILRASERLKFIAETLGRIEPMHAVNPGETYRQFLKVVANGREAVLHEFDTYRKVRRLAYSLSYAEGQTGRIVENQQWLETALHCIDNQFAYGMIPGIFDTLLQHWSHPNARLLRTLLEAKLSSYSGRRRDLLGIQKNLDFYKSENSAVLFGAKLVGEGRKLPEAWDILQLSDHMRRYEYLSQVASAYARFAVRGTFHVPDLTSIVEFLKVHEPDASKRDTSKRVLAPIIVKAKSTNDSQLQEEIKNVALERIGDPENDGKWYPWNNASQQDRDELKSAQQTVAQWLTEHIIGLFFERLAMDTSRRVFWQGYAKYITKFKIYANSNDKLALRRISDSRLAPYLNDRVGNLIGDRERSALVMVIKDFTLVEFSKVGGAFYAYDSTRPGTPNFWRYDIPISSLRDQKRAVRRVIHNSGWQWGLNTWLKYSVLK